MRAVIQRVKNAKVESEGIVLGSCKNGYLILFCAMTGDSDGDISTLAKKTANLRIFEDENGKMNRSIIDTDGEVLCISQFTLAADTKKGNRPSFINAMEPASAEEFYLRFCDELKNNGIKNVQTGRFGADMQVTLTNDGPVTIILDTDIWNKR